MKKTNAMKCLNIAEKALSDGIEGLIKEMQSRGISILSTESNIPSGGKISDVIYAYVLDGEFSSVVEREVKGFQVTNKGELYVCADIHNIYYRPEDLESAFADVDNENVYLLWQDGHIFNNDYLQTYLTAMCILRDIDCYLN